MMPVYGVPMSSAPVFDKNERLYTKHTHYLSSTITLTLPTHSLASFRNGFGCTLLQHPNLLAPNNQPIFDSIVLYP